MKLSDLEQIIAHAHRVGWDDRANQVLEKKMTLDQLKASLDSGPSEMEAKPIQDHVHQVILKFMEKIGA